MSVTESSMEALGALVHKAVGRFEVKAKARESLSIRTTVEFLDSGAVKLTQLRDVVTLTKGQAIELMERIAADVLTHQVRAS